ncbi:MAG: 4Fe-4S dicluster domain-containing protein [Acidobacteria bacterium]|nr:4Fe-4S dicluster domain-containing protein [Acidobacteriota bacterium]
MRAAFLFDPDRCTACEACRVACGIENNEGRDTGWRTISTFNPQRHPALPTRHLSLACNHCDTPACALGCPAAAYDRDETTGAVLLDPEKCIGCRYCSWVCPYDAPKFDDAHGVMTKCTFCAPRLAAGGQPACTAACPSGALALGVRESDEAEPSYYGLGSFGLGPSLKIEKPRRGGPPPALAIDELVLDAPSQPMPSRKITLSSEWALLVFTIVMPALVAWLGGGVVRTPRKPPLLVFAGFGALAMALSTMHLGKPMRAWRAILNLKSSWLSREILFTNVFLLLGVGSIAVPHTSVALGTPALLAGIALAISIDGVYRAIPRLHAKRMHSAEAVPTVAMLFGIVAGAPVVTIAAGLVKGVLYGWRWATKQESVPEPFGILRAALLGLACAPTMAWQYAFAVALLGEIIDRAAFYNALEPSSPARRMTEEART